MIDRKPLRVGGLAAALLLSAGLVQAALSPPVDGMVYDDVLDLCWLQDADASGNRTWDDAVDWAENLVFGGHDDWRLAQMSSSPSTMTVFDCSTGTEQDCSNSGNELGYMFYHNLTGLFPKTGNQGPFIDIQTLYWSGTEFAPNPPRAWRFRPGFGDQAVRTTDLQYYGWAVRPGQCRAAPDGAQPVPALGAWGLGALSLLLMLLARARLR